MNDYVNELCNKAIEHTNLILSVTALLGILVRLDNGKLNIPQGVWRIPFESSIPKYAYV